MGVKDKPDSKRARTKYTTEQLYALERSFCISQYPDTATMEDLADTCNVSVDKISTWFQNRRSKFKRQSKDTNISWMRNHVFCKDQSLPVTKATGNHVLSPPMTENKESTPKSNLNYMPTSSTSYMPPPTPFYPPVVPVDMFNDILRDVSTSPDSSPSTSNTTSPEQYQAGFSHHSSPQTSSPTTQQCLSPTISPYCPPSPPPYFPPPQNSSPQESCSPLQMSPLNQSSSPNQSYVFNSSLDSSSSSQQTTSPPSCHQALSPYSQQHVQGYYINQALSWHYFQTTMAQCMYRR